MILLGLGGNLPSAQFGAPRATLEAALGMLADAGVAVRQRSGWYRTTPVPDNGQPDFVNGVAELTTALAPAELLALLLEVEQRCGRIRAHRWAPRVLDLDLLAHHDTTNWASGAAAEPPTLPHPRLHQRAFVLIPLAEIAPEWRHPVLGRTAPELLAALRPGQYVATLDEAAAGAAAVSVAGSKAVR